MGKRKWLIKLRQDKEMLQREVAHKVGITEEFYSMIETGARRPSPQVAQRIAEVLEFPWTDFYS